MSSLALLDVYMHGQIAGTLERRSQARLRFTYGESWVAEERQPLSLSLPVRAEPYDHDECAPFFEGLLPEGDFLKAIARTLHISATNPFQLLTELGGECAGAISVAPSGGPPPGLDPRHPRWLDETELSGLLADLPQRPLVDLIDEEEDGGFRLSLAGAQTKVGVLARGDEIGLSYGKPPTTDILKVPIPHVEESVVNEAFCMSLAAHVDLDVALARPRLAGSREYLLVHRYDRDKEAPDGRIHQEDFCQALGLVPAVKYEREGGPTVADCAALIRRSVSAPARDITAFLDALLFNFAIANHDAHSKNYSLLLDGPGSIRLAPLYDLLCTTVFPDTDRKLAMRYGGENRPAYLRGRHLDRLAKDLEVRPALVRRRSIAMRERTEAAIDEVRRSLPTEFQDRPILDRMIEVIGERCETISKRATERSDAGRKAPPKQPTSAPVEGVSVVRMVGEGFENVNADLQGILEAFEGVGKRLDSLATLSAEERSEVGQLLADELEGPARGAKEHGRQIYDAVAAMDAVVDDMLVQEIEKDAANDDELTLFDLFEEMAKEADNGADALAETYSAISALEEMSPALRVPVRSIRSGLRDLQDARKMIRAWGSRARDFGATDPSSYR